MTRRPWERSDMADEPPKEFHGVPKRGVLVSVRLDGLGSKRPHQWAPDSWPAPVRWLTKVSHGLAIAEGVGIGFCLLAVVFLATWQFVDRNLVQHHLIDPESLVGRVLSVPGWTDGVIRHSVFLLGFLG